MLIKWRRALRTEPWDPPKAGQGDEEPAKETKKEHPVRWDSQERGMFWKASVSGRKVC